MWRQESDDAKRLRAQARELRQAPSTSSEDARARRPRTQHSQAGVAYKMKRWSRRFYGSIRGMWGGSGFDDDDEEEEERRRRSAAAGGLFEDREEIVASSFDPEAPLSKIRLIALSISLAGAQVAWTLELAYGTPYLLGLGLSPEAVSLVWLAGPASGLIMQPLIGALSDADVQSRFRRRKYMIYSAAIIFLSTLVLAFALPLSTLVVDLLNIGLGDWDPKRNAAAHRGTQIISVLSFWILDFALNGLQASSRALILDVAPTSQQTTANAYQGMMSNVGNVVGYLVGWINLSSWGILRWLGGGQFRRFAVFAVVIMVLCVAITVVSTRERPDFNASREGGSHQQQQMLQERAVLEQAKMTTGKRLRKILRDLWHAIRRLPRPIRRVCVTQTFNFAAWFCFLFYASQYYMEVKRLDAHHGSGDSDELMLRTTQKQQEQPSSDVDFEQGSFAMLMYAVVALASGFILPFFALGSDVRARAPQLPSSQSAHAHSASASSSLPGARAVQRRIHAIYRGLRYGITLRTLWSCGALLYAAIMAATFFVQTPVQAVILIASIGIPWSITAWAPFAMIGEFVREANAGSSPYEFEDDHHGPRRSAERRRRRSQVAVSSSADAPGFPFHAASDSGETPSSVSAGSDSRGGAPRRPILASSGGSSTAQLPGSLDTEDEAAMAGTVLGIHNLAIVIPQLLVSAARGNSFVYIPLMRLCADTHAAARCLSSRQSYLTLPTTRRGTGTMHLTTISKHCSSNSRQSSRMAHKSHGCCASVA